MDNEGRAAEVVFHQLYKNKSKKLRRLGVYPSYESLKKLHGIKFAPLLQQLHGELPSIGCPPRVKNPLGTFVQWSFHEVSTICINTPEGTVLKFDFHHLYDNTLASLPEWALSDLYEKISGKPKSGPIPQQTRQRSKHKKPAKRHNFSGEIIATATNICSRKSRNRRGC